MSKADPIFAMTDEEAMMEAQRRRTERCRRAQVRLREMSRLERHPHQQHAMALLNAVSGTAAARGGDNRNYWVIFSWRALQRAAQIRLSLR
jgi:hypothetical protein